MLEEKGELWDMHAANEWIAITTNGTIKKNGELVMGRGCAYEAKLLYPTMPKTLGDMISYSGNKVYMNLLNKIFSFPVKDHWWEKGNLKLIEKSAIELAAIMNSFPILKRVYIPRPGCGNGKLKWEDVKPILEKHWDDRFIVITK